MGKKAIALTLLLPLLFSAAGMPVFVNLVSAQFFPGEVLDDSPPKISIISPLNNTNFYGSSVSLNLTVSWGSSQKLYAIGYVLDGTPYGPFATNNGSGSPSNSSRNFSLKLTLIPEVHSIRAYANVTGYKVSAINYPQLEPIAVPSDWSDTINFTTVSASPTSTPVVPEFPFSIILLLSTVMVAVTGLLVYLKKHRQ